MQVEDGSGSLESGRLEVIMRDSYRNRDAMARFDKKGLQIGPLSQVRPRNWGKPLTRPEHFARARRSRGARSRATRTSPTLIPIAPSPTAAVISAGCCRYRSRPHDGPRDAPSQRLESQQDHVAREVKENGKIFERNRRCREADACKPPHAAGRQSCRLCWLRAPDLNPSDPVSTRSPRAHWSLRERNGRTDNLGTI